MINGTFTKLLLPFLIFSFIAQIQISGQKIRLHKRVMTATEFQKFKKLVGTYEKGKNYNKKINGHGTGLKPPTEKEWAKIKKQAVLIDKIIFHENKKEIERSYDNSATIWFPPIGNQDGEGSCVSWASGYYVKTFQEAKEHNWDLSACTWDGGYYGHPNEAYQDKIFSPDFIYHQVNGGEDNGSYYADNLNLLERTGCCTWDKMPYDPNDYTTWPNTDAWRQAPWYRSQTGYGYLSVETDEQLNDLKQLLANGNLAIISINADYYDYLTNEDLWTLDNYNPESTNHANTIVGYDDDYGPYTEGNNNNVYGAFKIANSWGVGGSWENVADGFYYISYECLKQRIQYVYEYENKENYQPEMVAVFNIEHEYRGENKIKFGIGEPDSPTSTKSFDDYYYNGGDYPYPANDIVFDITEFKSDMDDDNHFFMEVLDGETSATGTIKSFSIEEYNDYASGTPSEVYTSDETPVNTQNNEKVYANIYDSKLYLNCKIFLEGSYSDNHTMTTELNSQNVIPLSQPYNIAPWNYSGTESVSSIPSPDIVDWVLVELRSGIDANSSVAKRAGFLKKDGVIVDLDGTSELGFNNLTQGNYYIVVYHRNHIAVMSSSAVSFGSNSANVSIKGK